MEKITETPIETIGTLKFDNIWHKPTHLKTFFMIMQKKSEYKKQYSLRARIGITIARLLCLVSIEWLPEDKEK